MLRLIGTLVGSALAIAFLIVAIGTPQLSTPVAEPVAGPGVMATPVDRVEPAAVPVEELGPPAIVEAAPAPEPEPASAKPATATDMAMVEQLFAPEESRELVAPPEPVTEEHWYAFWSPFRSEIAASGFVEKLQQSTGIDYRVVKVKTGVYEVAFAYTDDADIEAKLERISSATGLDMSGS